MKVFYAKHTETVETDRIIRIVAPDRKAAEIINNNWSTGKKDKNVKVIVKSTSVEGYSASRVGEENRFYE